MKTKNFLKEDYYFVSFGREKGGYFDMLKLPSTATEEEASEEDRKIRVLMDKNFKISRKELKIRLEKDEITQEEFDASVKKLKEEKDQKVSELNRLLESYNAEISGRRKMENAGKFCKNIVWHNMVGIDNGDNPVDRLMEYKGALPVTDESKLTTLKYHFTEFLKNKKEVPKSEVLSEKKRVYSSSGNESPIQISEFSELVLQKKLTLLLYADMIWNDLDLYDRLFWINKISGWISEFEYRFPDIWFKNEVVKHQGKFSKLYNPLNLAIEKLQEEEYTDFTRTPKRAADRKDDVWMDFFNDLFSRQYKNPSGSNDQTTEEDMLIKALADLLKLGNAKI